MRISAVRGILVAVIAAGVVNLGFVQSAQAGIVDTAVVVDGGRQAHLDLIQSRLQRDEVRAQLRRFGVAPEAVEQRLAVMSDGELQQLAKRMGDAPAGGDALAVIGIVFIVLMILEFVGVIDIFKKIP
jgi:hypothetical protein